MTSAHNILGQRPRKPRQAAFQRYFQGWTEAKVPRRRGKGFRVIRLYTDPYRVHDMDDGSWIRRKVLYGVLTLLSLGLYLLAATARTAGNTAVLVLLPGSMAAGALLFVLVWMATYLSLRRRMTVYDQESSSRNVTRWCAAAAACLLCAGLGTGACLLGNGNRDGLRGALCAGAYVLSACAMLTVSLLERRTEYREEENDTVIPFDPEWDI